MFVYYMMTSLTTTHSFVLCNFIELVMFVYYMMTSLTTTHSFVLCNFIELVTFVYYMMTSLTDVGPHWTKIPYAHLNI